MIHFLVWLVGIVTLSTMMWRWTVRIPFWTYVRLSTPSRRLLYRMRHLPQDHRPDINLLPILRALDVKADGKAYRHYTNYEVFNWHDCTYHAEPFKSYSALHKEIEGIEKAIRARALALATAKVEPNLDTIGLMTERLREESRIIREVTKEIQ